MVQLCDGRMPSIVLLFAAAIHVPSSRKPKRYYGTARTVVDRGVGGGSCVPVTKVA